MAIDKYLFDIKFDNDEMGYRNAGIVPGGVRLHFDYFGGTVTTDSRKFEKSWSAPYRSFAEIRRAHSREPASDQKMEWYGFDGTVVRGTDWALALETGIIQYDGRMTLVSDDKKPVLVDMILTGTINIGTTGFRTFQQGGHIKGTVPGTFVARFEAAQPAKPWAAKHIRNQGEQSWKYQLLTRDVFLVDAVVTFSPSDGQSTIKLAVTARQVEQAENGKATMPSESPVATSSSTTEHRVAKASKNRRSSNRPTAAD